MFFILMRQSIRLSMKVAMPLRAVSLIITPNPGWLADLAMALFIVSGWLVILACSFELRDRLESRAELRDRLREARQGVALAYEGQRAAAFRQCEHELALLGKPPGGVHYHELSAGSVSGYLAGSGWISGHVLPEHVITVSNDKPCTLCQERARDDYAC